MTSRAVLTAAGALAIAGAGAGAGAGLYAAFAPATKTVITATTVDNAQPVSASTGLSINAIYQRTYQGVVDITVTSTDQGFPSPFGGSGSQQSEGSGFVYDSRGDIVTNEHVVSGASKILVRFANSSTPYRAHLVGSDSSTDLAVVRVSAPSSVLHPLMLGSSKSLKVGDPVIAIGSPFGLSQSVTSGIISALHRTMDTQTRYTIPDSIQTDAPINHGNSGGPLIDSAGRVIGVNAQIQSNSGGSDGVGFAIPSDTVGSVVGQIVAGKAVEHAYIGISLDTSSSPQGALITRVVTETPAARAGLHVGDVIVRLDSTAITTSEGLSSVMNAKKPGDNLSVTYVRGGKQHTVQVKLATRPSA